MMSKNKTWQKKVLLMVSLIFSSLIYTESAKAVDLVIYEDTLASGWEDWSWSSTLSADTAHKSSGASSLAIKYSAAWAGLSFRSATPINTVGYTAIQFAVYGSTGSGQLSLSTQATDSGANSPVFTFTPTANVWTLINVPLSSLGNPSQIARISIMDQTGAIQPTYNIDRLRLVNPVILSLNVDVNSTRKPISPLIYGINGGGDISFMQQLGISVRRWGGNDVSRYNWQLDASNSAADWYYENKRMSNATNLPDDSAVNRFVSVNKQAVVNSIVTIPMIGYVAKNGALSTCGFSVSKYGSQTQTDVWQPQCGNGIKSGGSFITGNTASDTSIAIGTPFIKNWLTYLVNRYGIANANGIKFYNLDNEPDIWFSTHRDIAPQGLTYNQLRDRTYQYAAAIKQVDPGAKLLGPVVMGWTYYWHSPYDGQRQDWVTPDDRNAHGGVPLVPWYLQQMKAYELSHGQRLLDYLDLHYYPAAPSVTLSPAGNAATQALRLESTRSLWDATYVDQSWIATAGPDGGIIKLIPRMKAWVNNNYPGTKLAITEYNWGAPEHINGALAQADVLGIFGREGLDLATLWSPPTVNQPLAFAFKIYRNYNGLGAKFGSTSVKAVSTSQNKLAIYAAEESTTGALTLMIINKTATNLTAPLTLTNFVPAGLVQKWRYSAAQLGQIVRLADQTISGNQFSNLFPANSISLYRIPGHR